MKRVIIGHRGVGKTSLLKRHQSYFPNLVHVDLDLEIEKIESLSISEIFKKKGESYFRNIEVTVFKNLTDQLNQFVISVGGGFNPHNIPIEFEVVFVSRATDNEGRIFINRPLINHKLSPLDDSIQLFQKRHQHFLDRANLVYHMPEGLENCNIFEKNILTQEDVSLGFVTLTQIKDFSLNYKKIELRTDFFSSSEILNLINEKNFFLISFRTPNSFFKIQSLVNIQLDWALELGEVPAEFNNKNDLVSIHEGRIEECIFRLSKYHDFNLKLCPVVNSWNELMMGHAWQQLDPEKRNFLPRCDDFSGKWKWYRLISLKNQKINFIQFKNNYPDQPTIYDSFLLTMKNYKSFLAVIGSPVKHSYSPITHQDYFDKLFLSICIDTNEFETAIVFLKSIGLCAAAVTSPLKEQAGRLCGLTEPCNSIKLINDQWIGISTDDQGFLKLVNQIPKDFLNNIVLWGGSGILVALKKILPDLVCYSARTGKVKNIQPIEQNPKVVIWAAPRNKSIQFPTDWKPQLVIDLNYVSNSMGLEYANQISCAYISGLDMFLEQAIHQRNFFKDVNL